METAFETNTRIVEDDLVLRRGYVHPIDLDGCTVYDAETLECMAREEVARKSKEKGFPITLVSWDIRVSTHGASLATWGKSRRHPGTVFSCGLMAI